MRCNCNRDIGIGSKPAKTSKDYRIQFVPSLPDKARIYPGLYIIQIGRDFWETLDDDKRAAVIAHELAHDEGRACEGCADERAGARLRWQGMGAERAVAALSSVVQGRRVADRALAGWKAADVAMRGLVEGGRATTGFMRETIAVPEHRGYKGGP